MNPNKDSVSVLLTKIQNGDERIRSMALDECAGLGVDVIKPLVELAEKSGFETVRMAKRCLWKIVRYSGSPGNEDLRRRVCGRLGEVINNCSVEIKREILWMFSEIGGDESVPIIARFLRDKDLREDARCSLERIPTRNSLSVLRKAFEDASDDFKYALADSLRFRGVKVKGCPSKKLVPMRQTNVGRKV
ncbi:MAG: hypothetical protein N2487_00555 [Verrucomicrobiae bacterium]|nr:hypothetical protein [Verrucomicrobiae bacterium]